MSTAERFSEIAL